jgi:hypothetical protein
MATVATPMPQITVVDEIFYCNAAIIHKHITPLLLVFIANHTIAAALR